MGKHKDKKRKHDKHKKKKGKRDKRIQSSSSSDSDEWVEKESIQASSKKKIEKSKRRHSSSSSSAEELIKKKHSKKWQEDTSTSSSDSSDQDDDKNRNDNQEKPSNKPVSNHQEREDWMNLSTSFSSTSHLDRRRERELQKQADRESKIYNPRTCVRELNPYWKDGGDGLPKFKKPTEDEDDTASMQKENTSRGSYASKISSSAGGWRKITRKSRSPSPHYDQKRNDDKAGGWRKTTKKSESPSPHYDQRRNEEKVGGWRKTAGKSRSPSPRYDQKRNDDKAGGWRKTIKKSELPSPHNDQRRNEEKVGGWRKASGKSRSPNPHYDQKKNDDKADGWRKTTKKSESPSPHYDQRRNEEEVSGWRKAARKSRSPSPLYDQKKNESKSGWRKTTDVRRSPSPCYDQMKNEVKTTEKEPEETSDVIVTDKDLNTLASKLVKAEIMGNTKLAEELKARLENARKIKENQPRIEQNEEIILTHTDAKGYSRPIRMQGEYDLPSGSKQKKKKVETHKDGQRMRYFADDDKHSLQQMFENEKYTSVEDENREFLKMASKIRKNDDLDDVFEDKIRHKESDSKMDERNRARAIGEHQRMSKSLDNCNRCLQSDNMLKHLMISLGDTVYLSLPPHEPLTEGHCLLIPIRHTTCAVQLDENEWQEVLDFRKALTKMFNAQDQDPVFFEIGTYLNRFPHMYLECVPLPREQGDLAPIYFKKAIDESEYEWSQNKKLVSLKGRNVRKAIPKGLPYFSVSFGMEEGFAHVIEEERYFPQNFAQEIIGGMLDLSHSKWRRPKRENFDEQSKRVMAFSKLWKDFDITKN